jgi:hypothetical protein
MSETKVFFENQFSSFAQNVDTADKKKPTSYQEAHARHSISKNVLSYMITTKIFMTERGLQMKIGFKGCFGLSGMGQRPI